HRSEPARRVDQQLSRRLRSARTGHFARAHTSQLAGKIRERRLVAGENAGGAAGPRGRDRRPGSRGCRSRGARRKEGRAVLAVSHPTGAGAIADFLALTKPRLNLLVVATSAAGYYLGAPSAPEPLRMAAAVAGTALVAGGAAALNQVYE